MWLTFTLSKLRSMLCNVMLQAFMFILPEDRTLKCCEPSAQRAAVPAWLRCTEVRDTTNFHGCELIASPQRPLIVETKKDLRPCTRCVHISTAGEMMKLDLHQ